LGKTIAVKQINADAKWVNEEILRCCLQKNFHYIDNDEIFNENGVISKSLYDARDPSGVHINEHGAKKLYNNLVAFLEGGISDELEMNTHRNKRLRSGDSLPSPSGVQSSKQVKIK
jgi:hypothetical protein